jgi:hypothetical protein
MATTAGTASAIESPFVQSFKCSRCSWTEDVEGGKKLLGPSGETLKEWTAEQWTAWRNEVEGIARGEAETSPAEASIAAEVPGITRGEAEDAANVVNDAREAGGGLGSDISSTLDFAGEAGGTLSLGLGTTLLGGLFLGPTAFHVGVDIGNGLDSLFGLPTWETFKEEASEGHGSDVVFHSEACLTNFCSETDNAKPGYYVDCYGDDFGYLQDHIGGEETFTGCGESGEELGPIEETFEGGRDRYKFFGWVLLVCAALTAESGCEVGSTHNSGNVGGTAAVPEGIPRPAALTSGQEAENAEHGLLSHPHVSAPATPLAGERILKTQDVEHISEEKTTREYIEEKSPHEKEYAEEQPAGLVPPSLPSVKLPHLPTPCTVFPFGVPCWFVTQVSSWNARPVAPKIELNLAGKPLVINLADAEPIMEIVRPVEAVLTCIGIVLLFGRFASSSSGSGDGGGGDD